MEFCLLMLFWWVVNTWQWISAEANVHCVLKATLSTCLHPRQLSLYVSHCPTVFYGNNPRSPKSIDTTTRFNLARSQIANFPISDGLREVFLSRKKMVLQNLFGFSPSAVGLRMWKSSPNFCWIICTPHRCEQPERTAVELILSALTQDSCLAFADTAYCSSRCAREAPECL